MNFSFLVRLWFRAWMHSLTRRALALWEACRRLGGYQAVGGGDPGGGGWDAADIQRRLIA
jgi:hypothetical protein